MKTKTINGWVIWTRDTTPMEDGNCAIFRSKADAIDELRYYFGFSADENTWRIARVTMTCEVPSKPRKKVRRAR